MSSMEEPIASSGGSEAREGTSLAADSSAQTEIANLSLEDPLPPSPRTAVTSGRLKTWATREYVDTEILWERDSWGNTRLSITTRHSSTGGDGRKRVISQAQIQISLSELGCLKPMRQIRAEKAGEIVPVSALSLPDFRRLSPKLFWPRSQDAKPLDLEVSYSQTVTNPDPLFMKDAIEIGRSSHSFVVSTRFLTADGEDDHLAAKIVPVKDDRSVADASEEMRLLGGLQHHHIIATVGSFVKTRSSDSNDAWYGVLLYPLALTNLEFLLRAVSTHNESRDKIDNWKCHESIDRLASYFACLCDAVMYLHTSNIKHRDIKPSNILIDQHQTVILADFSIARKYGRGTSSVTTGRQSYTAKYAPRSVKEHQPSGVEGDFFSLGCVFLEMTTVIMGSNLREMQSHLRGPHHSRRSPMYSEALEEGLVDSWLRHLQRMAEYSSLPAELGWSLPYVHKWLNTVKLMMNTRAGDDEILKHCWKVFKGADTFNCPHCPNASPESPDMPQQLLDRESVPYLQPRREGSLTIRVQSPSTRTCSTESSRTAPEILVQRASVASERNMIEMPHFRIRSASSFETLERPGKTAKDQTIQYRESHTTTDSARRRDLDTLDMSRNECIEARAQPPQQITGIWVLVLHRKFELIRASSFSDLSPADTVIKLRRSFSSRVRPFGSVYDLSLRHFVSKRINWMIGFGLVKLLAIYDPTSDGPRATRTRIQELEPKTTSSTLQSVKQGDYNFTEGLTEVQAQQDSSDSIRQQGTSSDLSFESQFRSEVGNAEVLSHPKAYFSSIKKVEAEVAKTCGIRGSFAHSPERDCFELRYPSHHAFGNETNFRTCEEVLGCLMEAMELLKSRRLLSTVYTVLIDDRDRHDTIHNVAVAETDIRDLLDRVTPSPPGPHPPQDTLLVARLRSMLRSPLSPHEICAILSLGLVSYAGAHCSNIFDHLDVDFPNSPGPKAINFPGPDIRRHSLTFRKRQLACLGPFVGGPVWVLGRTDTIASTTAQLCTTLRDLSGLWGPLYAIPAVKNFDSLIAIQTEAGVLTKAKSGPGRALDNEVHLTWSPLLSTGVASTIHEATRNLTTTMEFDPKLSLLIGHSSRPASLKDIEPQANGKLAVMTWARPRLPGLRHNSPCNTTLECVAKRNAGELHTVGTYDTHLVPDTITTAVSGGKFVSLSQGLSKKVWPASKRKGQLLLFCQDPKMINAVMDSLDGLEMSACSGNAQRLSLRETLKLAFPSATDFDHRSTYSKEQADSVLTWLTYLSKTGLDHKERLQCFLPSMSVPTVFRCDSKAPSWTAILQDTSDSACFATLSGRCLTYHGKDRMSRRIVQVPCSKRRNARIVSREIVFFTRLNLDERGVRGSGSDTETESATGTVLQVGQELRLDCGTLTVRNEQASGQLAYFSADLMICSFLPRKRTGIVHRELLDMQTASSNTVPVFISDPPPNAILAAMHRRFGNDG